jgi:segregation and condensation protein A
MYRVHLDQFEGPLDLLLFFIRRDELDIHDIPIARIADEYLDAVRTLQELDLDAAADFIYTAALLIQIKARMLLPRLAVDDDGEPVDPRAELVERLLDYIRLKEGAAQLTTAAEARRHVFVRGMAGEERALAPEAPDAPLRVSLFDLISALGTVLRRSAPVEPVTHAVERESYALDEQRAWLLAALEQKGQSFAALLRGRTKPFVIVTFLAALDLAQRQLVRIIHGVTPHDFALERAVPAPEPATA